MFPRISWWYMLSMRATAFRWASLILCRQDKMTADRKQTTRSMGLMTLLHIFQVVSSVPLLSDIHPIYAAAALIIFTEACWSFGIQCLWLNCLTLAIIERIRLGRGKITVKNHVHWELRADDRVIGWIPTKRGWRRHMRRLDRLT